jgi:uncharacterized cupredoxin-like copper-binding protein
MTAYIVLGLVPVGWALVLSAMGLLRESFPPTGTGARVLVGITVVLVGATMVALFATTQKEHPREEAAAKAAEEEAEGEQPPVPSRPASTVKVAENEFSINPDTGTSLPTNKYTFEAVNRGKIEHDLAIRGRGIEQSKTPLLEPGESAELTVSLPPGTYELYCTVPGHAEAGMSTELVVK